MAESAQHGGLRVLEWGSGAEVGADPVCGEVPLYAIIKSLDEKPVLTAYIFLDVIRDVRGCFTRFSRVVDGFPGIISGDFKEFRLHVVIDKGNEDAIMSITEYIDVFQDIPNICFEIYDFHTPPKWLLDYVKKTQFIYFTAEFPYESLYNWVKHYLTYSGFANGGGMRQPLSNGTSLF